MSDIRGRGASPLLILLAILAVGLIVKELKLSRHAGSGSAAHWVATAPA